MKAARIIVALFFVCSFMSGMAVLPAQADESEFNIYADLESFTWKEFDDAGRQLLKENGPRGGIGFAYHHVFGENGNGLALRPRIEIVTGNVDYHGQACDINGNCIPIGTTTDYLDTKLEFDIGGRFGGRTAFAVEPFIGLGYRDWWRDIKDTSFSLGYTEYWSSSYGRAGLRGDVRINEDSKFFFEAVAKLPIRNQNTAYLSDIGYSDDPVLHPGKKVTFSAEAGFRFYLFQFSFFYDSMRFKKSDQVFVFDFLTGNTVAVWQPKSQADIYGVKIGASF